MKEIIREEILKELGMSTGGGVIQHISESEFEEIADNITNNLVEKLNIANVSGFSIAEINLCRQYFNFWSDSHSDKAHEKKDYEVGKKLNEKCGIRVPNRIAENCR